MDILFLMVLVFGAGLLVGWNFLEQPQWMADKIEQWTNRS